MANHGSDRGGHLRWVTLGSKLYLELFDRSLKRSISPEGHRGPSSSTVEGEVTLMCHSVDSMVDDDNVGRRLNDGDGSET